MINNPIVRPSIETIIAIHKELIDKIGGGHGILKLIAQTKNLLTLA